MKKQFLLSLVTLSISVHSMAQVSGRNLQTVVPSPPQGMDKHFKGIGAFKTTKGLPKGEAARPTAIGERLFLSSNIANGTVVDSMYHFYSNGRQSYTVLLDNGTYESHSRADTAYYYHQRSEFKVAHPFYSIKWDNSNNHHLQQINYFTDATPYEIWNYTWDAGGTFVAHQSFRRNYTLGNNLSTDYFYQGTKYNKDGYGLYDTMILDYSKNDPSLKSNYVWTSALDIDAQGRPAFQRRMTVKNSEISIDSIWREYSSATDPKIHKEITKNYLTTLPGNTTKVEIWEVVWHYNAAGLRDSIFLTKDGLPNYLVSFVYNVDNVLIANTGYDWDVASTEYKEKERWAWTVNAAGMYDTVRYYTERKLTALAASIFTDKKNIKTIDQYDYNAAGAISAHNQVHYFYEEFDPTAIDLVQKPIQARLYPNPASSEFILNIEEDITTALQLNIMDLSGRMVQQQAITAPSVKIALASFAKGMYLIQVKNKENGRQFASKLVKN